MEPSTLQQLALLAPIVLATATVISLVWAVWSYRRNAEAQTRNAEAQVQLLALSTLQHYLDLAVAHPELASRDNAQPMDAQYAWFAAQALFTAQTLWTLAGDARRTGSGLSTPLCASSSRICGPAPWCARTSRRNLSAISGNGSRT